MSAPRWARRLLAWLAPADRLDDLLGDLEEGHHRRLARRGRLMAALLTGLEALDIAVALLRGRVSAGRSEIDSATTPLPSRRSSRGANLSWLDFKLGFRMLIKYPGLTVVGGVAIAFSIWVGASLFEFVTQVIDPELPLADGDRVVGVQLYDAAASRVEPRALHDYERWREELRSIEELGAVRVVKRNLSVDGRDGEPVEVAEISASAFRMARVPALLGRTLDAADERPGAPAVAAIGYGLWQSRFGGDPEVLGRTLSLSGEASSVVGVMPAGFAFPVAHSVWVPLRLSGLDVAPREGPPVRVFGRLAPGVSLREAQAELTALGLRAAADSPGTHEHLHPQVMKYAQSILAIPDVYKLGLASSNLFVVMLLVLVCGNVALLMFARAATREREIVVRNALGASRSRIVMQLFAEALVLGALGATLGLGAVQYGLRLVRTVVEAEVLEGGGQLPFWVGDGLSPRTLLYAVALTLLSAALAGIVPALKVTGRRVETRLRQSAVGGDHVRFGGIWTLVIVTQVALTVAFPATAFLVRRSLAWERDYDFGFPAEAYLSVRLELDMEARPGVPQETVEEFRARYARVARELESRLAAEPQVARVTFTDRLPGMYHFWRQIEIDEGAVVPPDERGHRVGNAYVAPGYFEALEANVVAGREFDSADPASEHRVVIVNEAFVEEVLGGSNPIGRRVRYVAYDEFDAGEPGPWHEVVGVVPHLGVQNGYGNKGIYHPIAPGDRYPLYMAVRASGSPESFGPRLRQIASSVDPTLRLHQMMSVSDARLDDIAFYGFWYRLTVMVSAVALFLALAGIYAVLSFNVARRTREIGIRVALGSDRRRVVLSIFRRPLLQVAAGVFLGGIWATIMAWSALGGVSFKGVAVAAVYAALMMGVCMLACIAPTRRALGVEPTDALRAEV